MLILYLLTIIFRKNIYKNKTFSMRFYLKIRYGPQIWLPALEDAQESRQMISPGILVVWKI